MKRILSLIAYALIAVPCLCKEVKEVKDAKEEKEKYGIALTLKNGFFYPGFFGSNLYLHDIISSIARYSHKYGSKSHRKYRILYAILAIRKGNKKSFIFVKSLSSPYCYSHLQPEQCQG